MFCKINKMYRYKNFMQQKRHWWNMCPLLLHAKSMWKRLFDVNTVLYAGAATGVLKIQSPFHLHSHELLSHPRSLLENQLFTARIGHSILGTIIFEAAASRRFAICCILFSSLAARLSSRHLSYCQQLILHFFFSVPLMMTWMQSTL